MTEKGTGNGGEPLYEEVKVSCWEEFLAERNRKCSSRGNGKPVWIFRGEQSQETVSQEPVSQETVSEELKTSLQKSFKLYDVPDKNKNWWKVERRLLREFQRKAHQYLQDRPGLKETLEWLALMQHYGAPTRLLDWTYSANVAAYMAVNQWDCKSKSKPVVWAIDATSLDTATHEWLSSIRDDARSQAKASHLDPDTAESNRVVRFLVEEVNPPPIVFNATPFRLNDRLTIQQGTFLVIGDITKTFWKNLQQAPPNKLIRFEFDIKPEERNKILLELHRMNINQAVLFPGLQGFSEGLRCQLA